MGGGWRGHTDATRACRACRAVTPLFSFHCKLDSRLVLCYGCSHRCPVQDSGTRQLGVAGPRWTSVGAGGPEVVGPEVAHCAAAASTRSRRACVRPVFKDACSSRLAPQEHRHLLLGRRREEVFMFTLFFTTAGMSSISTGRPESADDRMLKRSAMSGSTCMAPQQNTFILLWALQSTASGVFILAIHTLPGAVL
jgi:hypothetical protein